MFFFRILFGWLLMAAYAVAQSPNSKFQTSMISIPPGTFQRSDGKEVQVDAFSLLAAEVTWSQFKYVKDWAEKNGYEFEEGIGEGILPAQNITWFDAVKWCNALSEICHKTPAYYLDPEHRTIYRHGRADLVIANVNWDADGYRLPTEAEWEYAYRGGTLTNYYWGDHARADPVNHSYAAFHVWGTEEIDGGPLPVASKNPNPFGFYDMAGNVEEWVWDRYAIDYAGVGTDNPRGPDQGPLRILRGGGFVIDRLFHADARHPSFPFHVQCDIGLRVASSYPAADSDVLSRMPTLPLTNKNIIPFSESRKTLDAREDSDASACARLMPLLNMNHENLQAVRKAHDQQDYTSALSLLRDLFCGRLKTSDLEPWLSGNVDMQQADRWLGIYREQRPIRWAGPDSDVTSPIGFIADEHLARAYVKTAQREYADAYLWMVNDAALHAKPAWNRLTKAEKGSLGKPRDSFYAFIGFDAGDPLKSFICIAWMLKHDFPPEEIPPRILANALHSAVVDRLASGLQDDRAAIPNQLWANAMTIVEFSHIFPELKDADFLKAEGISRICNAMGTVLPDGTDLEASLNYNKQLFVYRQKLNRLFSDRKTWPEWLVELNRRADNRRLMYASLMTPFGTFPAVGNQQATDPGARAILKGWLEKGELKGLEAAISPVLSDSEVTFPESPSPAFTSVALPYGGYYAQRSGWARDDLYLFMRSSRDGVGHNHQDNNSIQVAAYGSWLLVDSGSPAYGPAYLPDHQKKYFHYFGEESLGNVFQANCLAVDGRAQSGPFEKLLHPTTGWEMPRQNLLHHSEYFDLVEGIYDGWYESETPISDTRMKDLINDYGRDEVVEIEAYNARLKREGRRRLHAVHGRQVIFLKPEKLWIVVDEVDGGHELTQTWNFPPTNESSEPNRFSQEKSQVDGELDQRQSSGFAPQEVASNAKTKRVITSSHDRPNIAILNFTPETVRYRQHFGQMFPLRGWHSFNISGEKVPAVQVECTWRGKAPMLTVLFPMQKRHSNSDSAHFGIKAFKDLSRKNVSGLEYVAEDIKIICKSSHQPSKLVAGPIAAQACLLLVREAATGSISGLALGCTHISSDNGVSQSLEISNVEFEFRAGQWTFVPINPPSTFRWLDAGNEQLRPAYQ